MSKSINTLKLLSFLLIAVLLSGCTYQIKVRQAKMPEFQDNHEKILLNVGLYLSKETRNYVIAESYGGLFKFLIGESIAASAPESLRMIFPNLTVIDDKDKVDANVDRIITIDFGRSTKFKMGALVISEHRAWIELRCKVYDKKWNLLWKKSALGKISRTPNVAVVFVHYTIFHKELGKIVNESLTEALEWLNVWISTTGKDAILKAS